MLVNDHSNQFVMLCFLATNDVIMCGKGLRGHCVSLMMYIMSPNTQHFMTLYG